MIKNTTQDDGKQYRIQLHRGRSGPGNPDSYRDSLYASSHSACLSFFQEKESNKADTKDM